MSSRDDVPGFLPLKTDTLLVLLVLQRGPRHGYGIIRDVEARSGGETVLQTGALYRLLKRLLEDGLIEEVVPAGSPDAEDRRRYYQATRFGAEVLAAEVERMARLVRQARAQAAGGRPRLA